MAEYNPINERIKRSYLRYQAEAGGKSDKTIVSIRVAINKFEEYTKYKNFSTFNKDQASHFKKWLLQQKTKRTGESLSKSTALQITNNLKDFFRWLSYQPGFKSKICVYDIEYFNLNDKEISIAKAAKIKKFPTLEQARHVILSMPIETEIQRRDRAVIAFALLTGMRDDALASILLTHVNVIDHPPYVEQHPKDVRTKFSKYIISYFLPVGDDIKQIAIDWIKELREVKLYSINDPVFPQTLLGHDQNKSFTAIGLKPECWASATPIRKIFADAFERVGLPYFNPHLFRDTLTDLGIKICKTPEQLKAWSLNVGHNKVLTTLTNYGDITPHRQGQVIYSIGKNPESDMIAKLFEAIHAIKNPG